jgi:hypothetical protein
MKTFVLALCVLLSACSYQTGEGALAEDVDTALKLCAPNDGLQSVRTHQACPRYEQCKRTHMSAICKNGAQFSKV